MFIGGGFCEEDFFVLTAEGAEGTEKEKREKWCCSQIT